MNTNWYVTTFYYFLPLRELEKHKLAWEIKAQELGVRGLLILGPEGFNTTCCAEDKDSLEAYKAWVTHHYPASKGMLFKDSQSHVTPFKRFKAKIRPEIVTLHTPELVPDNNPHKHLSPDEWNQVLKSEPESVVIDTRNWYEYNIGTFERAINPNIEKFTEFPAWFEQQGIKKDQKILIFCTGGIRCEKGIYELERQGYPNVYQLEGGIINYIDQHPNDQFKGECFVFDRRVALDQSLKPSGRYSLCPHCGQPAYLSKECKHCDSDYMVCPNCDKKAESQDLCSKNCVYQYSVKRTQLNQAQPHV